MTLLEVQNKNIAAGLSENIGWKRLEIIFCSFSLQCWEPLVIVQDNIVLGLCCQCVKANRVILAAVSPVMRNVFTKREGLMNAEVIPLEELSQLVRFVYKWGPETAWNVS